MNTAQGKRAPSRELRAQAAAWLAKLHGPERSPELEADFQGWIKASSEHARAFEHVTEVWDSVTIATTAGLPRVATDRRETRKASRTGPGANLKIVLAAAASVLGAGIGITWLLASGDRYTTTIGEQRTLTLADGSRVSLNSNTRVDVDLGSTQRFITLKHGEAYFEVAKDPARPFVVTAGERRITALGTTFDVRYDPQATTVTLVEGRVTVASGSADTTAEPAGSVDVSTAGSSDPGSSDGLLKSRRLTLRPGERVTFRASETPVLDTPRPETTASWRRGEVILDDTPLKAAAAEMNRYQRERLVVDDPEVAGLPVSGIYKTGDSTGFARAVAKVYDLDITTSAGEIRLHRK